MLSLKAVDVFEMYILQYKVVLHQKLYEKTMETF
jgi:hypothetical protein